MPRTRAGVAGGPVERRLDRFARARVRHEVLAALRELNPAAELNIARTAALLRDEDDGAPRDRRRSA